MLALISILVPSYSDGIRFFHDGLGFEIVEDVDQGGGKRWLRLRPGQGGADILLAEAKGKQRAFIGNQGGGRVWLFLQTDDFARDHARYAAAGAIFEEPPRDEPYGTVAVFRDPFGNRWDLIQRA